MLMCGKGRRQDVQRTYFEVLTLWFLNFSKASSFKLNCKSKCSSCKCASRRHLYQSYLNLMRSRIPCRLMYFQNGEWVDLPSETLGLVRKDFELKKEAIEVNLNSHHLLLDFLHMIHLDVKTGLEQPLGWMDEAGSCFFPEFFTFEGVQDDCCQCYADKEEIKLQIDIKLNGAKETPSVEYNGESNPIIKILKVAQNHPSHHLEADVEDNCDRVSNPNIKNIEHSEKVLYMGIQSVDETLAYEEVMKMFGKGIHSAANGVDIVDMSRCSGSMVEARMEIFQKQIEITTKHRGDANVRYAWLASSKEALMSVMAYGLGPLGLPNFKSFHDTGVPLAAADFCSTRFIRMWKAMLECHHAQYITISLAYHARSLTHTSNGEARKQIMAHLLYEFECFSLSFADWMGSHVSYAEALNGWLECCIVLPRERSKIRRPFSPRRVLAPPIFVLCRDWATGVKALPADEVNAAIKSFLADLHHLMKQQVEDQQKDSEVASSVDHEESGCKGEEDSNDKSSNLHCIHTSLTKVLDRLTKFSEASLKLYEEVRQRSEAAHVAYSNCRPARS